MQWSDEGLVLSVRRHGETSIIVEAMTLSHGRHLGLVRGGRSPRLRAALQPGNSIDLHWRARLSEHLGNFRIEARRARAATLMQSQIGLYGVQLLACHLRLLPERDPHAGLYRAALVTLEHLDEAEKAARLMVRFELALLEELGFGLDLSRCVLTGAQADLAHVSPRSGRAVSRAAGAPYAGKLLELPLFLTQGPGEAAAPATPAEILSGFALSGYFLEKHAPIPEAAATLRASFIRATMEGLSE